ncbi:hypothetical protein BDQ12DRAFT_729095 [Crucibulum laeve]|uniref:Uncharacterized protein n=1 Tax=Crucibulum laeve TaxID=68775 RepID=A0A5C3LJ78_9AGAR|nr:hypothetical protein BDQ12DRAFT_729095 [Crucibulum laeve]
MEETLEKGGRKGKKGKKDKKMESQGPRKSTASEATTTNPGLVATPVHLTKSEKVLEDSGISVAPPKHTHDTSITVVQPARTVTNEHQRHSDIQVTQSIINEDSIQGDSDSSSSDADADDILSSSDTDSENKNASTSSGADTPISYADTNDTTTIDKTGEDVFTTGGADTPVNYINTDDAITTNKAGKE